MPRESHKNKCGARKIAKNGTAIDIDILFRRNYWTDKLILKFRHEAKHDAINALERTITFRVCKLLERVRFNLASLIYIYIYFKFRSWILS